MEDIFSQMLQMADEGAQGIMTSRASDTSMENLIDVIKQITMPIEPVTPTARTLLVNDFDQSMNLLNYEVQEKFTKEIVGLETKSLTYPKLSTSTVYGSFVNVSMHERDWVQVLWPDKHILALRCNFGEKIYAKYAPPPRKVKKERKNKVKRKRQGTGTEFNSQLTFVMNSDPDAFLPEDVIPTGQLVFKIKVFRNGKIQLPGNYLLYVDNIIRSVKYIESMLNMTFNAQVCDLARLVSIISVNICMKNYKFAIKKQDNQVIDLARLAAVFADKRILAESAIPHAIIDIIPNTTRANLSILFKTATYSDQNKKLRLTIERSGKVNIKGGLYVEYSAQVFSLLDYILGRVYNIIINKYQAKTEEFNIAQLRTNREVMEYWQK